TASGRTRSRTGGRVTLAAHGICHRTADRAHARQARDRAARGRRLALRAKWDGFRAIVFREGERIYLQSRDLRPLDRYFPELLDPLRANLPQSAVVDGEIVIAGEEGLDFEALQLRLHPAASRVAKLAAETPSSFVAFDLLAEGGHDLRGVAQSEPWGPV